MTCNTSAGSASRATSSTSSVSPLSDSTGGVPVKRTWDACAGLHESEVPLAELDPSICFGEDYPEPIRYDRQRRVLCYRGTMSHASFMRLAALSRDRHYQRALEQLFVASALPPEAVSRRGKWLAGAGLAAAAGIVIAVAGWFVLSGRASWSGPAAGDETVMAAGGQAQADAPSAPPEGDESDERVAQAPEEQR